jgi:quinol monooxygenase YgiN
VPKESLTLNAKLAAARVIVEGSSRVSEPDREVFLDLVRQVVQSSVHRKGCLKFSVAEDIIERNLFHLTELWADMESLDASRFGDENKAMLVKFAPLDVRDRDVRIYLISSSLPE